MRRTILLQPGRGARWPRARRAAGHRPRCSRARPSRSTRGSRSSGPLNDRAATPALVEQLESLIAQARAGESRFEAAINAAERAAGRRARAQSGKLDRGAGSTVGGGRGGRAGGERAGRRSIRSARHCLAEQGGLAPSDQQAIARAAAIVGEIDRRQAAAIAAVKARLGS